MMRVIAMAAAGFFTVVGNAEAQNWLLDPAISEVSFGSIKRDNVGEVHRFDRIDGYVTDDGTVQIALDLTSVNTNIALRNSRVIEHLFGDFGAAAIRTQIDLERLAKLPVGGIEIYSVFGTLDFLGQAHDLQLEMVVTRLAETRVMASSRNMIFLNAEDLGLSSGLKKLAELADLPGITSAVPVTLRLVFNSDGSNTLGAAVTSANVTLSEQGDAKRGLKVYMRCFSCHSVKKGRHSTGPSLAGIIGRPAGGADGYQYSEALTDASFTWDEEALAAFLAAPQKAVPGTSMAFDGLADQSDIADLLSYLKAF